MRYSRILMFGFLVSFFVSCSVLNSGRQKVNSSAIAVKTDTAKKTASDTSKTGLKPYKEIITADAFTRQGLFTVHKVKERYFFEIPNTILEKDLLIVSRITQGAAGSKQWLGYAGDEIGQSQIQFSKGPSNKLFIRLLSYGEVSLDSSDNGMHRTVKASTLQPIQATFDIRALRPDSLACVIDVTDFLNSDNPLLYFDGEGKKNLTLGGYQKDKSYVTEVMAFPLNVELRAVNSYVDTRGLPKTYGLNVSFVLLPAEPMKPRYFDQRVGYFKRGYLDYDAPEGVKARQMITRWRLEPKEEDKHRYLRGELVEPKKPIVFYIDPATPKKWVPYLMQGVNDWQKAFEKAGFRNAIYALEAPVNDTTFSLFDARHSAIVYKASPIPNASGPHIHDPRTGEILESHINWYHNIMELVHDWYMVQAGPNDPSAQKMVFEDKLMGELIRFVCSHEVGHTLGLRHNMAASSAVPTDSLRSKTYLDKNGFCPSIMDYARFNYVAQPEDGLTRSQLMPRIGVYDEWAIEWGYRWLPQLNSLEQEQNYMSQWITSSLKKDKRLLWIEYEGGPFSAVGDPRTQTEDLGNDAMKAGYYGIQNLKRVMSQLKSWTVVPNQDYSGLLKMYSQVYSQYNRYIMHVANNIGNKYWTEKSAGQDGPVVQFIPRNVQKRAMKLLEEELFDTPEWLYNKELFSLVGGPGVFISLPPQTQVINWLVTITNYVTMTYAQTHQPKDVYTYDEQLTDMEAAIWKELDKGKLITFARRNLQKVYVERMIQKGAPARYDNEAINTDFYPIMQKHMQGILNNINRALSIYKDEDSRLHLIELKNRLVQALNSTRFPQGSNAALSTTPANTVVAYPDEKMNDFFQLDNVIDSLYTPVKNGNCPSCWTPYNYQYPINYNLSSKK